MIKIDQNEVALINQNYVQATQQIIDKSYRQARAKILRQIKTLMSRQLSNGLKAKEMKQRLRIGKHKSNLWLGTNAFKAHQYSKLKQTKSGIRYGKDRKVNQAFIAKGKDSGKLMAFKRVNAKRYPIKVVEDRHIQDKDHKAISNQAHQWFEDKFYNLYEKQLSWNLTRN